MLVAAFHKPVFAVPLVIMADTPGAIPTVLKGAERPAGQRRLITSLIFTISFSHLKKAEHMKVLKISYPDKDAIYKIVLNSHFNQRVRDCWLQHQPQGWVILLGNELDRYLASAITTAISSREFLVNQPFKN